MYFNSQEKTLITIRVQLNVDARKEKEKDKLMHIR